MLGVIIHTSDEKFAWVDTSKTQFTGDGTDKFWHLAINFPEKKVTEYLLKVKPSR